MATVLIGADICPIEGNKPYFISGDATSLFHDLLPEFAAADLVMANLECPLINAPSPIPKTGPKFGEPPECLKGIQAAGIDLLGLANNHIMDHGAAGLKNTLAACAQAGVATVGAGENLEAARRLFIRKIGNVRVAVMAVAEHEFSIATKNSWGANPLDPMEFVRDIARERNNFDYLIVLLHGSGEFIAPTPRIQNTCRFMIETGANAVIVQHPHVLGGCEEYRGGHIVYGQGALVMDEAIYRSRQSFHEGFLVKLTIDDDARSKMELIPFVQSTPVPGAKKLQGAAEKTFREALTKRSQAILDPAFVDAEWVAFCKENKYGYLSSVLGHNKILRKLNRNGKLMKVLHSERVQLGMRNSILCETHREALETIFDRLER
jgi:hypothetical protein